MDWVERPDGVRLAVRERGEGPGLVAAHSLVQHPNVYGGLHEGLARHFRVVLFDPRGSGGSTRAGPYDIATGADDLGAVIEAHGPVELAVANGDAAHWAVHLAARRPDLLPHVVALETVPFRARDAADSEALAGSVGVLEALVSMMGADYRAGLHAALQRANPGMSDDEMRERVDATAAYTSPEAGLARLEAWIADDASEAARALGDRLTIAYEGSGEWFPASLHELAETFLPEARFVRLERGAISDAELTVDAVREIVSYAN